MTLKSWECIDCRRIKWSEKIKELCTACTLKGTHCEFCGGPGEVPHYYNQIMDSVLCWECQWMEEDWPSDPAVFELSELFGISLKEAVQIVAQSKAEASA